MSARVFQKINELISEGKTFAVATIVRVEGSSPRGPGAKMVILEDGSTFGSIGGDCAERAVVDEALKVLDKDKPKTLSIPLEEEEKGGVGMKCGGEIEVSIEVVRPSPKLVITGAGRIATSVAELAEKMGFSITVVDPFAKTKDFPDSVEIISEPVEQGLSDVEITPNTYVVIITRHKDDIPSLKAVLDKGAAYIGLMGSKSRVKAQLKELAKEGFSDEELSQVHAPIGLDIGAETPEEIAVSIMAEVIREKRSPEASGESLKISP